MKKQGFGTTKDGKEALLYTLSNKNGMEISVTDYGDAHERIHVEDQTKEKAQSLKNRLKTSKQNRYGCTRHDRPLGQSVRQFNGLSCRSKDKRNAQSRPRNRFGNVLSGTCLV